MQKGVVFYSTLTKWLQINDIVRILQWCIIGSTTRTSAMKKSINFSLTLALLVMLTNIVTADDTLFRTVISQKDTTIDGEYHLDLEMRSTDKVNGWTASNTDESSILIKTKIFLEGAYDADSDEMITSLKDGGYIPRTSPYSDDPRTAQTVPSNVTDWVPVQIRTVGTGVATHNDQVQNDDKNDYWKKNVGKESKVPGGSPLAKSAGVSTPQGDKL